MTAPLASETVDALILANGDVHRRRPEGWRRLSRSNTRPRTCPGSTPVAGTRLAGFAHGCSYAIRVIAASTPTTARETPGIDHVAVDGARVYCSGTNTSHSTTPIGTSIFGSDMSMSPFFWNGVPPCT